MRAEYILGGMVGRIAVHKVKDEPDDGVEIEAPNDEAVDHVLDYADFL